MQKFKRMNEHSIFLGVMSGLAYFLEAPVWIVRSIFCIFCFLAGFSGLFFVFLYLLVGFLAPQFDIDPQNYEEVCE
jgi:phage shock protein PspC (stress-responsive transcriptional regulator)